MKRSLIQVLVVFVMVLAAGVIYFNSNVTFTDENIIQLSSIVFVVIFASILFYNKLTHKSDKELISTVKIFRRSASASFYLSITMWLLLLFLVNSCDIDPVAVIEVGIIAMGLIFAGSWIFFCNRQNK